MQAKVRQVLRDPDTAEFMGDQIDILVEHYIQASKAVNEEGRPEMSETEKTARRRDIKRLRAIQRNLRHNAAQIRERAGEEFADEL